MSSNQVTYPDEPRRVIAFANFFKRYMSISSVVAAALPIPVTLFKLIPTYKVHVGILSTYTPLFCFLALGFIFYIRHPLARLMFPEYLTSKGEPSSTGIAVFRRELVKPFVTFLPALLILASLLCLYFYHETLNVSLAFQGMRAAEESLLFTDLQEIDKGTTLLALYLGMFVFAEASFILMAMKEYLQDILGYTEIALIMGPQTSESASSEE